MKSKTLLKELKKVIQKGFGRKCQLWAFGCPICAAYQALETLDDLLEEDVIKKSKKHKK